MHTLLRAGLLAATSALVLPALAQTANGKKELVAKIVALQQPGVEALARDLTVQPAMQLMQQAGQALQRLPTERREAVARDVEADLRKYADETVPLVSARAVKLAPATVGPMLEERLSEDELRQIVAMLESPTVRKYQAMTGEMQKLLVEKLVADSKGEVEPRVQKLQQTIARRLAPPAAPAASGNGAAPAKK